MTCETRLSLVTFHVLFNHFKLSTFCLSVTAVLYFRPICIRVLMLTIPTLWFYVFYLHFVGCDYLMLSCFSFYIHSMFMCIVLLEYQNPFHQFPRGSCQVVASLLATSCNGIRETTQHNRHNGLLTAPTIQTCCGLVVYVADLLRTCYGETGVMDFGLCA